MYYSNNSRIFDYQKGTKKQFIFNILKYNIMQFQEIIKNVFQILKDNNIKTKSEYITESEAILILPPCSLKNAFIFLNKNKIENAVSRDNQNVYLEIYA